MTIREALALCARNGARRTIHVIKAKLDAVIVPEIVFREIAVQVFLSTVLIDALHAAFEDRIVAFDRIRVNVTHDVHLR